MLLRDDRGRRVDQAYPTKRTIPCFYKQLLSREQKQKNDKKIHRSLMTRNGQMVSKSQKALGARSEIQVPASRRN